MIRLRFSVVLVCLPARMLIGNFERRPSSFKVLTPLLKNGHIRSFSDPYTKAFVIKVM